MDRFCKHTKIHRLFLTCDLGLDLALHLQRVDEDAAVTDKAGASDASVWLAESLFIKIIPETNRETENRVQNLKTGINNINTFSISAIFVQLEEQEGFCR